MYCRRWQAWKCQLESRSWPKEAKILKATGFTQDYPHRALGLWWGLHWQEKKDLGLTEAWATGAKAGSTRPSLRAETWRPASIEQNSGLFYFFNQCTETLQILITSWEEHTSILGVYLKYTLYCFLESQRGLQWCWRCASHLPFDRRWVFTSILQPLEGDMKVIPASSPTDQILLNPPSPLSRHKSMFTDSRSFIFRKPLNTCILNNNWKDKNLILIFSIAEFLVPWRNKKLALVGMDLYGKPSKSVLLRETKFIRLIFFKLFKTLKGPISIIQWSRKVFILRTKEFLTTWISKQPIWLFHTLI